MGMAGSYLAETTTAHRSSETQSDGTWHRWEDAIKIDVRDLGVKMLTEISWENISFCQDCDKRYVFLNKQEIHDHLSAQLKLHAIELELIWFRSVGSNPNTYTKLILKQSEITVFSLNN